MKIQIIYEFSIFTCRNYAIVGSKIIRPNSDYHVAVSLFDVLLPWEIRVAIEGDNNGYNNHRDIIVHPYTSQLVHFNTGDMPPGEYKLNCKGLAGTDFHQQKSLEFQTKNTSIFVQSDKAIYKPGDTIRFRVLVVDMNLKPLSNQGGINIFITVSVSFSSVFEFFFKSNCFITIIVLGW